MVDGCIGGLEHEVSGIMKRFKDCASQHKKVYNKVLRWNFFQHSFNFFLLTGSSLQRHTSILAAGVTRDRQARGNYPTSRPPFVEHRKLIDSLSKGYPSKSMKFFVAMSALIAKDDYRILGPILWQHCLLNNADSSLTTSAYFLLMQCAEGTQWICLLFLRSICKR